jgi:hypothetical protein
MKLCSGKIRKKGDAYSILGGGSSHTKTFELKNYCGLPQKTSFMNNPKAKDEKLSEKAFAFNQKVSF